MGSLKGNMVREVEIKSDGDVFLETYRYNPHYFSDMSPNTVRHVDLCEGDLGTVGSLLLWHYNDHDGKEKSNKVLLEIIDEEKKLMTLTAVEGDFSQQFKTIRITLQVVKKGETEVVIWTLEYEKLSEDVEDPTPFMDILIGVTKDIEAHHLKQ